MTIINSKGLCPFLQREPRAEPQRDSVFQGTRKEEEGDDGTLSTVHLPGGGDWQVPLLPPGGAAG